MTHPLTPREKVADRLCDKVQAEYPNVLTALASGSGDHAELASLKAAMSKSNDEICQSLGKALGYPWFKDDQRNFPGATEENGVCVGEHVAESIADEAASRISALLAENAAVRRERDEANASATAWSRTVGEMAVIGEDWKERCVEAERKLAEAVGHVEQLVDRLHSIRDSSIVLIAARTFLSKEAERG